MSWIKLDDSFPDHPSILAAGDLAGWLYVCGLCYCSKHLTDGFIPDGALARLTGLSKPRALAAKLVELGRWEVVEGGWRVHNYAARQRSRAEVENVRASARERRAKSRSGSREPVANDAVTEAERRGPDTDPPGGDAPESNGSDTTQRLVSGYVTDYRATHHDNDPSTAWKGQAGKAVKAALADGADPGELELCLAAIAKESKSPGVLAHVLADYQAREAS